MCGLCGLIGEAGAGHWSAPLETDGPVRQQHYLRMQALNRVLSLYRLTLSSVSGSGYLLSSPTGHQVLVNEVDTLWQQVEALSKQVIDPLESAWLDRLERTHAGP